MKNSGLYQLFIDQLEDMYNAEHQIIEALPHLIQQASLPELKDALSNHLQETKHQVQRLEQIQSALNIPSEKNTCEAMEGILKEGEEITQNFNKSPLLDAAIIAAAQKVEHYEMA